MQTLDLCLAMMPYQALERPSPALGLLTAVARGAGYRVVSTYPGFRFASRIGTGTYQRLAGSYLNLLGEWTFAKAAFPDHADDPPSYYRLLQETLPAGRRLPYTLDELLTVREHATAFVREEALRIVERRPRVVACGSQFQQQCASLALLREVKRLAPSTITLLGGQCCSGQQGRTLREAFGWLDIVFSGEADGVLPELLHRLNEYGPAIPRGKLPPGAIAATGFVPDAQGEPAYAITPDLDAVPVPDHDDYFRERAEAAHDETPYIAFEGGRGCDWAHRTGGCTFCATASERAAFRPKSAPRLLQELFTLHRRHAIRAFEAADEMCSPAFFADFFPKLAAMDEPPFLLGFDVRASLGEDDVRLLRDAGCVWLQPGIESLSAEALRCMNKGVGPAVAIRLLRLDLEHGVRTSWNILRGFPGEAAAWYDEIADLAPALAHLEPPNACGRLRIDRNSLYQREPERFGLRLRPARFYRHLFPLEEATLAGLASFFEHEGSPPGLPEDHPSVVRLSATIRAWQESWQDEAARPLLQMQASGATTNGSPGGRTDGQIIVIDTRPCAVEPQVMLTPAQAALLRACRDPLPRRNFDLVLQKRGVDLSPDETRAGLALLTERRFVVEAGDMLVSVVAHPPRFPLPTPEDVLAGNVRLR